ncbi:MULTISPECIES: COX15/CtaA family protein [Flavobacterium]|uniref:COX15/CtaA family protein n=1 Tax=Flavobacterium keumense TaxID=1306518 RepID=A0ABY8N2L9_9FLAO|nr:MULTISPECIES: COX15/CtaA family protein [Flavobacterium]WGK93900.1 COX15/CtaA family protein [Flavobacterium keumense]
MKKYFLPSAKAALILVYLVIIAGALVRMTGSGMGCPDWPKCFGYYIPPTEEKELLYTIGKEYSKGQVIIKDETLLVAKDNFTAPTRFESSHWEKYTKHDYALFNPFHTWVEYINRLVGALAGIACIIALFLSFSYWKENKKLIFYSLFICFLMGFQAWLGKTVVDSVLNPYKITTHMLAALLIVAVQLYLIYTTQEKKQTQLIDNEFKWVLFAALGLTIVQILFGTQVRESVDTIVEAGLPKEVWLQNPKGGFYTHRSFSILVVCANAFLFWRNRKMELGFTKMDWVIALLCVEILSGIAMYYFNFPFGSQTIHIVMATLLFGLQFYLVLENFKKNTQ